MGDPARLLPVVKNGRSAYFVQQNRGKKSLCLDFAKPQAIELLRSLAAKVDVVYPDQRSIGVFVWPTALFMPKNAPHPEEARKLLQFIGMPFRAS